MGVSGKKKGRILDTVPRWVRKGISRIKKNFPHVVLGGKQEIALVLFRRERISRVKDAPVLEKRKEIGNA